MSHERNLHARVGGSGAVIQRSVIVQQIDKRQRVATTTLEVVRVMRRRDLDGAGSKVHLDELAVADDWNAAVVLQRMEDKLAVQVLKKMTQ